MVERDWTTLNDGDRVALGFVEGYAIRGRRVRRVDGVNLEVRWDDGRTQIIPDNCIVKIREVK